MDLWYHLKCNDAECNIYTISDRYNYNDSDLLKLLRLYKTKKGRRGNDIKRRLRDIDEKNYENVYDPQFDYSFLNPINLNYNVNENFTNRQTYLGLYVSIFTILLTLFLIVKKIVV